MHANQRPSEPASGDPLWAQLSRYTIGPADAALPFAARLARENGWSASYAERVVGEYMRFAYLAVRAGRPVSPSAPVDQAWHLHLTYSRDYWERFCPDVLGAPLHHDPTAGGPAERDRHYAQYADTLAAYQQAFGAPPPPDIWPAARDALIDAPRRRWVDPERAFILSKPKVAMVLTAMIGVAVLAYLL
jgi:hypothetical protein